MYERVSVKSLRTFYYMYQKMFFSLMNSEIDYKMM